MNPHLLVLVLAALSMIGALSYDGYLPALPAIAAGFHVSLGVAQQSITIYMFASATMTLFCGTLADSFGRRPVILGSLAVYLVGTVGVGCAPTFGWLMFFRLVQGLCAGAGSVVSTAMINDLFAAREAERMTSRVSMVFNLSPALAPILGGYVQVTFGWRAIFLLIAAFALVLLLICLRGLPESLAPDRRQAFHLRIILANYWRVARHRDLILQAAGSALIFSGVILYIGCAPAFIFNLLHLQATDFGWLFLPLIGGLTLGFLAAGWMSHRASGTTTIWLGFGLALFFALLNVLYCAYFPLRVPWAALPMSFGSFGAALSAPAMSVRTLALFPQVRGLTSSLLNFSFLILFSLGAGVVGPLLFDSGLHLALGTAVGTVLGLICWWAGTRDSLPSPPMEIPA